jgi:Mg/Co/Ni transporter MgtE
MLPTHNAPPKAMVCVGSCYVKQNWTIEEVLTYIRQHGHECETLSISGSMLPLLLKKRNFDPATSSAPFVATLVDITGLIIYFLVGYLILKESFL